MTGRNRAAAAAVAGLVTCGLLVVSAAASTTGRADRATIYAANTHLVGGYVYSAGQGRDALLGQVAVTYKIKARPSGSTGTFNLKAKRVVLYTAGGSLTGTATATLTAAANGAETISNGKFWLKNGTGSLRGHSYKGTFTGTGNATTNMIIEHVTGSLK